MANQLSSFLNGSMLVIKIGKVQFAYCQSLSFSERMNIQPVGGMGSYSYQNIEPLQYSAGGSMQILRYSKKMLDLVTGQTPAQSPANIGNMNAQNDGNSLLDSLHFNPASILVSSTFDIEVYDRRGVGADVTANTKKLMVIKDCRLTNYSISFTPGQLLNESVQYVCMGIEDYASDGTTKLQGR